MPIPESYREVLGLLARATAEGRVDWTERAGSFVAPFSNFEFAMWGGQDEENGKDFVAVAIQAPKGERGGPIDNWFVEEDDQDYRYMEALRQDARRRARSIDNKLDEMRASLKKVLQVE